jgi:hypothetical protein
LLLLTIEHLGGSVTFGIGFVGPVYAGVITDRRLSGSLVDDEYPKCGVVVFRNARFAYTFAGLAGGGRNDLDAEWWLAESLCDAGAPDGNARASIARFAEIATQKFATLRYPAAKKRLTVMLVGYIDSPLGFSRPLVCFVSNFEDNDRPFSDVAQDRFVVSSHELDENVSAVRPIGSGYRQQARFDEMGALLARNAPPWEVTAAGIEVIRAASVDPTTQGTIGMQCNSVVLGRNAGSPMFTDYAVDYVTPTYRSGSHVFADWSDEKGAWVKIKPEFTGYGQDGTVVPVRVPVVAKDAPCPCNSGKKYRRCHERRDAYNVTSINTSERFIIKKFGTEDMDLGLEIRGGLGAITGAGLPDLTTLNFRKKTAPR